MLVADFADHDKTTPQECILLKVNKERMLMMIMMMIMMPTYDVANVSGGDHDEEDDRPEHLSPHRHVERVHVRTLGSFCFLMRSMVIHCQ